MTIAYTVGGFIDFGIMYYTYHFLTKVRHYPCVKSKMGTDIYTWSLIIAFCGIIAAYMPYYSFRAIKHGFDCTTKIATIFQILVFIYFFTLLYFHIKTTKSK